jgi:hypothetical protein
MATVLKIAFHGLPLSYLLAFFFLFELCFCFSLKYQKLSTTGTSWSPAGATWYGSRNGAGSDGNVLIERERERERERVLHFVMCTNKIYLCRRSLWLW